MAGPFKNKDKKEKDKKSKSKEKDNAVVKSGDKKNGIKKEKRADKKKEKKVGKKKEKKVDKKTKKNDELSKQKCKASKVNVSTTKHQAGTIESSYGNHNPISEATKILNKIQKDSIEQHREQYEQDQNVNDIYDQESMAMDLESLRRKPWYQNIKNEPNREQVMDCSQEEAAHYEQWLRQYVDKNIDNADGNSEDTRTETECSDNPTSASSESVEERTMVTQYELDERKIYNYNVISLKPQPRVIDLAEEEARLEYARRSVERLQKIEELRKSRLQYKEKLEGKKQRRQERKDRARQEKVRAAAARESSYVLTNTFRARPSRPELVDLTDYQDGPTVPSNRPMLVDLTDICDRTGTKYRTSYHHPMNVEDEPGALQSIKVMRWKSSFREEIPVIVDFSNENKPTQILDLTRISEPTMRISPPRCNKRLDSLRREREEKLEKMTKKFNKVQKKDKRDSALSTYHKLMEKVTKEFKRGVCG